MRASILIAALGLCGTVKAGEPAIHVRVEGHVAHPATLTLPYAARYADAAIAAAPSREAYFIGADLIRASTVEGQVRLRAGILDSLAVAASEAAKQANDVAAGAARSMRGWIGAMPVTGRVVVAMLDPRVVEITPSANLHLADGDILRYPSRPATVRIVGAVKTPCEVPFEPMKDASRYLPACPATGAANIETFYVVQPDGTVIRQGRALWNHSEPLSLAPGAIMYVPLKAAITEKVDPDLDHDIAAFLATQVLP